MTIDERLARLEESVARLTARLDTLDAAQSAGSARAPRPAEPLRVALPRENPFASKSTEWWLARGGGVLTLFALILLYQYAVARDWITPIVRIAAGMLIGGLLFIAGQRTPRGHNAADIGMREVLLGSALGAWYITAYAAAIFYTLIPVSAARLVFLALSILGAWLSLRETRSILANLSLAVGFATPLLLPSVNPSIPAFSVYLATLTAIGIIIYLMRGWQLPLWLTFFAFWASTGSATAIACCADSSTDIHIAGSITAARIALSILIVAGALAFMRAPSLRRGLLATGSDLYTQARRSQYTANLQGELAHAVARITSRPAEDDSAILWAFVLVSPLAALLQLSWTLNHAPLWQWGIIALISALIAWQAIASSRELDSELRHVLAGGVALWSLAGLGVTVADATPAPLDSAALTLLAISIHALVVLELTHASRYAVPRRIALATSLGALFTVLFSELIARSAGGLFDAQWLIAELAAVALAFWVWFNRRHFGIDAFARVLGVGGYIALLVIDARVLGDIWQPLVTASYAVAGAALLMVARGSDGANAMRRLGSVTLVIVVARLLLVDLARVETIWRVLLFLGCGALFLVTSHRLQASQGREQSA
jgi:uncharacterized membrane protein